MERYQGVGNAGFTLNKSMKAKDMSKFKYTMLAGALTVLASAISPQSATAVEVSSRIVGGDDADREYPWMVALYANGGFICGGVVVSNNWIATAAHCVYQDEDNSGDATAYDASYFDVVIGQATHYSSTSTASSAGVDVYEIESVVINPDYDEDTIDYDIALLELATPYYEAGPAIITADQFDTIEEGDLITNIGYGYMSTDSNASADEVIPTTLQQADLPYVPDNECYWDNWNLVTDNMFCAGYIGSSVNIDSCSGDSGGPMFMELDGQLTLVGLVSWGSSDCAEVPGVYTNVSNLRSWVLDNIDGYQVVEEGTASYDSSSDTYESGLISVYNYGDSSDELDIATLSFDDSDIDSSLTVSDACSDTTLYASDGSCAIEFDLAQQATEEDLYEATLQVKSSDMGAYQSYDLRFNTESDVDYDSLETTDDSSDSTDDSSDSSDDSDYSDTVDDSDSSDSEEDDTEDEFTLGSFEYLSVMLLGFVGWRRRRS